MAVLIDQLNKYPLLAAVKTDMQNYYDLLHGKLSVHIGLTGVIGEQSNLVERKRKETAAEIYGNLGLLIHHYRHNLEMIKPFFDMGMLKNRVHRKKKAKK